MCGCTHPVANRGNVGSTRVDMSLELLTYEHEEQLKAFLKFFRSKRNYQIKEVQACFRDHIDVLNEDMYTREEMQKSLDSLCSAVQSSVLTDLQMTANMSMLVLRQLLEEAEACDVEIDLDISIVEDRSLLSEVNKISIDAPTRRDRKRKNVKLEGIRDEHQRMMDEFEGVKSENKRLTDRCRKLESRASSLKQKRNVLREEVARLRSQLTAAGLRPIEGSSGSKDKDAGDVASAEAKFNETASSSMVRQPAGPVRDWSRNELEEVYNKLLGEHNALKERLANQPSGIVRGASSGPGGGSITFGESSSGRPDSGGSPTSFHAGGKSSDAVGTIVSSGGKMEDLPPSGSPLATMSTASMESMDRHQLVQHLQEAKVLLRDSGVNMDAERAKALERVMKTTQFKQMKRMLNTKNEQIEDLRSRLRVYEPEADEHGVRK